LPRKHAVDGPGNVNNTLAALTGLRVGHATHLDDQSGTLWGPETAQKVITNRSPRTGDTASLTDKARRWSRNHGHEAEQRDRNTWA
jgi:hypothetical protein